MPEPGNSTERTRPIPSRTGPLRSEFSRTDGSPSSHAGPLRISPGTRTHRRSSRPLRSSFLSPRTDGSSFSKPNGGTPGDTAVHLRTDNYAAHRAQGRSKLRPYLLEVSKLWLLPVLGRATAGTTARRSSWASASYRRWAAVPLWPAELKPGGAQGRPEPREALLRLRAAHLPVFPVGGRSASSSRAPLRLWGAERAAEGAEGRPQQGPAVQRLCAQGLPILCLGRRGSGHKGLPSDAGARRPAGRTCFGRGWQQCLLPVQSARALGERLPKQGRGPWQERPRAWPGRRPRTRAQGTPTAEFRRFRRFRRVPGSGFPLRALLRPIHLRTGAHSL